MELTKPEALALSQKVCKSLLQPATWQEIQTSYADEFAAVKARTSEDGFNRILWMAYATASAEAAKIGETVPVPLVPKPRAKDAPAATTEATKPIVATPPADGEDNRPAKFLAAIAEFERVGNELSQHFNDQHIRLMERLIFAELPQADLNAANKVLVSSKQRKLSYRDIAFVFCVHKKNTEKSDTGLSEQSAIVGMSKIGVAEKYIENQLEIRQVALCLLLLEQIGFTRCIEKADARLRKGGRYEITLSEEVQSEYQNLY